MSTKSLLRQFVHSMAVIQTIMKWHGCGVLKTWDLIHLQHLVMHDFGQVV